MTTTALVLAHLDPAKKVEVTLDPGLTIAEIVHLSVGRADAEGRVRAAPEVYGHVRVLWGDQAIPRDCWDTWKPKPGHRLVIRVLPGKDALRSVLQIAVSVAAIALGQFYGPGLAAGLGLSGAVGTQIARGLITAGVTLIGGLLINALVPVRQNENRKGSPTYSIQGWQNQANPDGPVPRVLGKHRFAPPYAAPPYTEVIGDDQYVVAIFCLGYGPVAISNHRLGETPLDEYTDWEAEIRYGYPDDDPITLYPQQVLQENFAVRITNSGGPVPVVRYSASDVIAVSFDISFPQGLIGFNNKGEERWREVGFRFSYRKVGDEDWTIQPQVTIANKKQQPITRSFRIDFPERGRYEIKVERLTADSDDNPKTVNRSDLTALRSIRPGYPIDFGHPVALVALKIKATEQLNGIVDNYNCDVSSIVPDWDAPTGTWIERETRNPASLFVSVLQGPENTFRLVNDDLDLEDIQRWHAFCAAKGLTYNRVHDYEASVFEVLLDIAAAGRATPHDRGDKWTVVVDTPKTVISAHISPRNSWDFEGQRTYVKPPDAFRVRFVDETNDYANGERIVPWPGFVGDPQVFEALDLPGITNPDQVYKEARRRQYEVIYRPDRFTVSQDFEALVTTRGDLAALSHDVLNREQVAARVVSISTRRVELDEMITMEAGRTYAIRFRRADGSSILRSLQTKPGTSRKLRFSGPGALPAVGDLAFFGPSTRVSYEAIVQSVDRGDNLTAQLTLMPHAPEIEALVDATIPPAWDGRVGGEIGLGNLIPPAPIIVDVRSDDYAETGMLLVGLRPGGFSVPVASYEVDHRISGSGVWTTVAVPAGGDTALITGYFLEDEVEIRARAFSWTGDSGPYSEEVTHVIGSGDTIVPPVTGLSGTYESGPDRNAFTWSQPSTYAGVDRAHLYKSDADDFGTATKIGTFYGGPSVAMSAVDPAPGDQFYYWVTAGDAARESAPESTGLIGPT